MVVKKELYDTEIRTRFIELRGKDWSIKRIADASLPAPEALPGLLPNGTSQSGVDLQIID